MATLHFALDAVDSDHTLANGWGYIAGMALSVQSLRDQGFGAGTYTGNRLSTIEHTAAGYNSSCERGWYRTPTGVQLARPMTQAAADLQTLKNTFRNLHTQLHGWANGLDALARGQPPNLVNAGHAWLYHAHFAGYLVGTNQLASPFNALSSAQRMAWANRMAQGAADVTSPFEFYQRENAITSGDLVDGPPGPATWVNPSTGTALNLAASLYSGSTPAFAAVGGVDISVVNLTTGDWIDGLTS